MYISDIYCWLIQEKFSFQFASELFIIEPFTVIREEKQSSVSTFSCAGTPVARFTVLVTEKQSRKQQDAAQALSESEWGTLIRRRHNQNDVQNRWYSHIVFFSEIE